MGGQHVRIRHLGCIAALTQDQADLTAAEKLNGGIAQRFASMGLAP